MVRGYKNLASRMVDRHSGLLVWTASQASSLLRGATLYGTFPVRHNIGDVKYTI